MPMFYFGRPFFITISEKRTRRSTSSANRLRLATRARLYAILRILSGSGRIGVSGLCWPETSRALRELRDRCIAFAEHLPCRDSMQNRISYLLYVCTWHLPSRAATLSRGEPTTPVYHLICAAFDLA